jgi:hypothetical protein
MKSRFMNKLLATSLALASAGILTCVAALLDALLPRVSTVAFLAWLSLAGLAVLFIVLGFRWVCDKLDNALPTQTQWHVNGAVPKARLVTSARGGHPVAIFDPPAKCSPPTVSRPLQDYPLTLRGVIRSVNPRIATAWHGQ